MRHKPWPFLDYWNSGEWQVVDERLKDLKKKGIFFNPEKESLFRALELCPLEKTRVIIIGQDPYPQSRFATGVAFSVPVTCNEWPPTLQALLQEYQDDLHYPPPKSGNLDLWSSNGVLMWNAIPSCETGKSKSHDWSEWMFLTKEIITRLAEREATVFAFIGSRAREYIKFLPEEDRKDAICTAHPSPKAIGNRNYKAFSGCRLFTRLNGKLTEQGLSPINWRLE